MSVSSTLPFPVPTQPAAHVASPLLIEAVPDQYLVRLRLLRSLTNVLLLLQLPFIVVLAYDP